MAADLTISIAFAAGIVSFLSPCILPLVPAFISYLAGSVGGAKKPSRMKIFMNSVFFVIGFSLVFSILGVVLNSILGSVAFDARIWLSRIGGVVIIFFGLYLTGALKFLTDRIPFLTSAHRIQPRRFKSQYLNSFIFGVAFAAGWTPCVGAILGGILTLAITQPAAAFNLMLAYSFGIGIPFLVAGAFISQTSSFISRFAGFMKWFTLAMGIVLILLGVLVATGYIGAISVFLPIEMLGAG